MLKKIEYSRLCFLIIPIAVFVFSLIMTGDFFFTLMFTTWLTMAVHYLRHPNENVVILSFLAALFTFLMGREVIYQFTGVCEYLMFDDVSSNRHTFISITIALLFSAFGYSYFKKRDKNMPERKRLKCQRYNMGGMVNELRVVSKLVFYFTYIFYFIRLVIEIINIRNVGYVESYQNGMGASVPWIVDKLQIFCPAAFFVFLATFPKKREARLPIILYLVYNVGTLLTGQRFPVMAAAFFVLIYFSIRNRCGEVWLKKKYVIILVICAPFVLIGLYVFDSIRTGKGFQLNGLFSGVTDFFSMQGSSINPIKYGYYLRDIIPDRAYGISSIMSNILNQGGSGNTLEYAYNGHSFAAIMTCFVYGEDMYLAGHGIGTSYIAELYHDLSYIGIAAGSFLYGYVMDKINQIHYSKPIKSTFFMLMVSPLLFAPRGEFDGIIGVAFRRGTLVAVIMIAVAAKVLHITNGFEFVRHILLSIKKNQQSIDVNGD